MNLENFDSASLSQSHIKEQVEQERERLIEGRISTPMVQSPTHQNAESRRMSNQQKEYLYNLLSYRQINGPFIYLLSYAFILPTYDNVHYFFLLSTCKLTLAHYDILCILPYMGIACGTIYYLRYLRR